MESSNPNAQKYKLIVDTASGNTWVKQLVQPGSGSNTAIRLPVQTGPKGGQYFISTEDRKVYCSNVSAVTQVWPTDSLKTPPPYGQASFGNTEADKRNQ